MPIVTLLLGNYNCICEYSTKNVLTTKQTVFRKIKGLQNLKIDCSSFGDTHRNQTSRNSLKCARIQNSDDVEMTLVP